MFSQKISPHSFPVGKDITKKNLNSFTEKIIFYYLSMFITIAQYTYFSS